MGRPLKIQKTATSGAAKQGGTYNVGVAGGDTSLAGAQINVRCKIGSNAEAEGFIIRQKGSRKFLVEDASANQGVCTIVDKNDASLGADEMTITVILPDSGTDRLERITNKFGITHAGTKVALSFTDIANDTETLATGTIDVCQVDNDDTYEE